MADETPNMQTPPAAAPPAAQEQSGTSSPLGVPAKSESSTKEEQGEPEKKLNPIDRWLLRFSSVKLMEKVFFMQHLELMLRAGFPISRALSTLSRQTSNKKFRSTIDTIRGDVEAGSTFYRALRKHPKVFPNLIVNMIESGEVSGKLDQVLKQIAIQLRKEHSLKSKVRGALIYPIIVIVAMVGIGVSMMIFVIPKMTAIYEEVGADLPIPTQILISTSRFVVGNGIVVGIAFTAAIVLIVRFIRTKKGKRLLHTVLLRTPVVGAIIKKVNLARFARTLSSLIKTDLPIVKAFTVISGTLGNVLYSEYVGASVNELKKGVTISASLQRDENLFPPMITQMVSVGEESGTLDETTEELASFFEEEVDQTMANLSTIIEPILMVILGVAVGGMAVALILPMYNLADAI